MKITSPIVFAVILFSCVHTWAQQSYVDSLRAVLQTQVWDTSRVNTLNELSYRLFSSVPADAIRYGTQARELAEKLDYSRGKAYALKNIGLGYYMQGDYFNVLEKWKASLKAFDEMGDRLGVANLVNNLGAVYYNQGDNARAIDYYMESLKVSEEIGDKLRIATAYVNIGTVYLNKPSTHIIALRYFMKALPVNEELGDQEAIGATAANIGEIYLAAENYDSALLYFEKSLLAYHQYGSGNATYPLNSLGKIMLERKNYDRALNYHQEALQLASKIDDKVNMAKALIGLANTYRRIQDQRLATANFEAAETIAVEVGANNELQEIYLGLARAYAERGLFQKAFEYQAKLTEINNILNSADYEKEVQKLQFSFEIDKKQDEINLLQKTAEIQVLQTKRQRAISIASGIIGLLFLILAIGIFSRYRYVRKTKRIIEAEKERSENLLLNILPAETAEELKRDGEAKARSYDEVTILFTDFKGFTTIAAQLTPEELVHEIHHCYKTFDEIVTRRGVEKIKTIGDAYMAAGGLPVPNETHALDVVKAAVEIREYMARLKDERIAQNRPYFEIRIGIHTGPVVAGIVGTKKFAYDMWGDTVNIAARMESNSEPGMINISEATSEMVKDHVELAYRGEIEAKNRGMLKMFFVTSTKESASKLDLKTTRAHG